MRLYPSNFPAAVAIKPFLVNVFAEREGSQSNSIVIISHCIAKKEQTAGISQLDSQWGMIFLWVSGPPPPSEPVTVEKKWHNPNGGNIGLGLLGLSGGGLLIILEMV